MKRTRKGFTLVELLIVVAILATLTAAMTASINGASAKAKASTIASNVNIMKTVAKACQSNGGSLPKTTVTTLSTATADDVLKAGMPSWADFSDNTDTDAKITYTAGVAAENQGPDNWVVTVDFSAEPERDDIADVLMKIKGYRKNYVEGTGENAGVYTPTAIFKKAKASRTAAADYKFKVFLVKDRIEAVTE